MSLLSPILRGGEDNSLMFWCPGCDGPHAIHHGQGAGARWNWNGNAEKPTFTPSILVRYTRPLSDEEHEAYMRGEGLPAPVKIVCHSFVTEGKIQFLGDCTHELAGQTVDIPEWEKA